MKRLITASSIFHDKEMCWLSNFFSDELKLADMSPIFQKIEGLCKWNYCFGVSFLSSVINVLKMVFLLATWCT